MPEGIYEIGKAVSGRETGKGLWKTAKKNLQMSVHFIS